MDDLRIAPGPGCPHGLVVPAGELTERFSHASGPGGQGVNTADSRVQLSLDLATTTALDDVQRQRALTHLGERLNGSVLTVAAAEHRSQRHNRVAARERLAAVLRASLAPPRLRRPTKPSRAAKNAPPSRQKETFRAQSGAPSPRHGISRLGEQGRAPLTGLDSSPYPSVTLKNTPTACWAGSHPTKPYLSPLAAGHYVPYLQAR